MAARWRVVGDTQREDLTLQGDFVTNRVVRFELLESGAVGEVVIPLRSYTPEFVAAEIQQIADRIEAVRKLSTG